MSEYTEVELEIKDPECLKAALLELGYKFEEHKEPQKLKGYQGDDRDQKAHIIVRRKYVGSSANDVGFLKDGKHYKMIISEFDRHAGSQSVNFMSKLKQTYTKHVILKKTKSMGYRVSSQTTLSDGRIKIRVSEM